MSGLQLKYFTLNPAKQDDYGRAARAAMLAYASEIEPENKDLAIDLRAWVRRTEPARANGSVPAIGSPWPGQGGIYAGIVRGATGALDYHLIVAAEDRDDIAWKDANTWADTRCGEGHRDFALPLRKEQAVLFGNVPELFEKAWYWSSEQSAGDDAYAWCQSFDNGGQYGSHNGSQLRARAVRRLTI